MCKSLSILVLLILAASQSSAQAPSVISFQARLTDPVGTPIDTPSVSVTFKLYRDGLPVWEEVHPSVSIASGLLNVHLGQTTRLDTIPFRYPFELGIKIGDDAEMSPRTVLAASPFAKALPGFYTFVGDESADLETVNVVGGARTNWISGGVIGSTISGGGSAAVPHGHPNAIHSDFGTIGGGAGNYISHLANSSTIGGGTTNSSDAELVTIGGGSGNHAKGPRSTICGGWGNWTSGDYATVLGGLFNQARGKNSIAAGYKARARHDGSFVWNDRSVIEGNDSLLSTAANQFLIRAAGGVGIGTDAPANQLSVNGAVDISGKLGIATNAPGANLHITGANGSGSGIRLESNNLDMLNMYYTGETGFVIDSYRLKDGRRLPILLQPVGGRVGIGTTAPGFLLEVNGDAAKPGGGSWTVASDRRLKDVQHSYDRSFEAIKSLKPVVYRYKSGNPAGLPSDVLYVGLIAQDVERVIPEAVSADDAGYLHLNNDPIIWTMLNAINDLRAENERQRIELEELRTEMETLRRAL